MSNSAVPCNKRKGSLKGLPGTGEKPPHCDGWFAPKFCSNPDCEDPLVLRKGNCKEALCPDCSTAWRFDRAESIVKRLYSYKLEFGKRLRHFSVSPSPYWVEKLEKGLIDEDFLFREVMKTVKWKTRDENGGGVVIYHSDRLTDEGKKKAKEIKRERDDLAPGECGDWKAILSLENWEDYTYFSPHFHVIIEIDKGKNWKEGFEDKDGGFNWKGIREVQNGQDILKLSMYLLSHAGILKDKQSIRWFGDVSTNKWSFKNASDKVQDKVKADFRIYVNEYEKAEDFSVKTCSICGSELIDMDNLIEYLPDYPTEKKAYLLAMYLMQRRKKGPPRRLKTENELKEWLKEEFSTLFSADSIFKGIQPEAVRGFICSMPEEVKKNAKLRKKFWTDPQKVIEHFESSGGPKYYS